MSKEISSKIKSAFEESIDLKKIILKDELFRILEEWGTLIANSIAEGGKLMTCGNGGSAADAQHLAAEFLVRLTSEVNREGIPAISLLQDSSTFTATINDFDLDGDLEIFVGTNYNLLGIDFKDIGTVENFWSM